MASFQIDPDRSVLTAEASSNLHPIRIETSGLRGTIEVRVGADGLHLDPLPTAQLELPVELLRSGIELYDMEVQRMLEARKFPRLRGELLEVRPAGPGRYHLRGKLSLHGVTADLEGEVRVQVDGDVLEIEGEKTIDMRDFDLDPPRILMLRVNPEVAVRARVIAVRAAGPG